MSCALLSFLLLSAGPAVTPAPETAASAGSATVRLAADEAVTRAVAASPRLARLAALEAAAGARRRGAGAERLPQFDIAGSYTRRSDVPELTLSMPPTDPAKPPQRVTVFPNIPDNTRLRAGFLLPIFTGGRVGGQLAATQHERTAAEQDLRAGRADLILETKTAYWSLVTAREGARVLQEAIRAFEAHLGDARNRERFGLAARNEVLAVQVELDRVELDRLRADAGAQLAGANLRRRLDLSPATRIESTDSLAALPPETPNVEALVTEASVRPERQALAARVAAAEALIGVDHGSRLPQVAASGGYTYANPNRDIVPPTANWKDTWDIGVGLTWNLFDFGRRSAGEARARAQADAAREQLRELDQAIRLEVT